MTAREIFEKRYNSYLECLEDQNVYTWAASEIFDLTTYDDGLDEIFVRTICTVAKGIILRRTFDFMNDDSLYIAYIVVCNMFERRHWIDWGTSIRGAWFDENTKAEPIFESYDETPDVPFTKENLVTLIEFIEEKAKEEESK